MEPSDFLKKIRDIEADLTYTRRSRRLVLSSGRQLRFPNPWRLIVQSFRIGSTALATGLLIIIIVIGWFSAGRFLTPFKLASLDPETLRAEADAIDIQIQLANLGEYESEPPVLEVKSLEKPPKAATPLQTDEPQKPTEPDSEAIAGPEIPSSSSTEPITIDQILEILNQ